MILAENLILSYFCLDVNTHLINSVVFPDVTSGYTEHKKYHFSLLYLVNAKINLQNLVLR